MRLWDRAQGRVAVAPVDAVGGQRFTPAHVCRQPAVVACLFLLYVKEIQKQLIVVAAQHDPVASRRDPVDQCLDHPAAVRATVDKIAQKDHTRALAAFGLDQRQGIPQLVAMAVNVGDDIDRIAHAPWETTRRTRSSGFRVCAMSAGQKTPVSRRRARKPPRNASGPKVSAPRAGHNQTTSKDSGRTCWNLPVASSFLTTDASIGAST